MNTDCILCNGAVDSVINFMNENEKVGVYGGHLLNLDSSKQNSIANTPTLITELFNKSILRGLFPKKYLGKMRQDCCTKIFSFYFEVTD